MAIPVNSLRTEAQRRRFGQFQSTHMCELCGKEIKEPSTAPMAAIDHEQYEFVTKDEAAIRGNAVSLFPVGPDCAKKIAKALKAP